MGITVAWLKNTVKGLSYYSAVNFAVRAKSWLSSAVFVILCLVFGAVICIFKKMLWPELIQTAHCTPI